MTTTDGEQGVSFVPTDGKRSSQAVARSVVAAATAEIDKEQGSRVQHESAWRKTYPVHVRNLVELQTASATTAVHSAEAGLAAVHDRMEFVTPDGPRPLRDVAGDAEGGSLATIRIDGGGARIEQLAIPYRGRMLTGGALSAQLEKWETSGIVEPSCRAAVERLIAEPGWLDLRDVDIVLLGAASEMGPLRSLSEWGANVIAVDLPRSYLWEKIFGLAERGSGTLVAPVRRSVGSGSDPGTVAGVDLFEDMGEVVAWLAGRERPFVLGNYVYADGANFVRLQAAVDAMTVELVKRDKVAMTAYLATPTDVFAVTPEIADAAMGQPLRRKAMRGLARTLSGGRLYAPNYTRRTQGDEGRTWWTYDCLIPQQGANYSLAKSMQRWRAMTAAAQGVRTSANVAPATSTRSVVKNRILAAAYAGAAHYGVEVFEPATSSALEAALLVHDLRNPERAAPDHPFDTFVDQAAHGGLWRLQHSPRSVLPLAAVRGLAKRKT